MNHCDLLYKQECYKIIGLCMKIHNILGRGFNELVYQDALEMELIKDKIPFVREKTFTVQYEGETLKRIFRVDFLVFDCIILELKALPFLSFVEGFRQTLNYLKASGIQLGLLINFGHDKLNFKRIICSH
ncbi:MAG: GxxExxY protein [Chitinophagaceae bacterium]|nr:MAG: GxxExxY protein [Chitinophagaceae bacterium]